MIKVKTEARVAVRLIEKVGKKILYAAAAGLNKLGEDFREAQYLGITQNFTVRRGKWVKNNIRTPRGGRATYNRLRRIVAMQQPGGRGESTGYSPFGKFERGGAITAHDPAFPFAVPSLNLRPNKAAEVPRSLLPKNLRLTPYRTPKGDNLPVHQHTTKRGVKQVKGKRRTFILDPASHFGVAVWGIYQRTGKGRRDVRLLWTLRRSMEIPDDLNFYSTARRTARLRWAANFRASLIDELRGRRGRA